MRINPRQKNPSTWGVPSRQRKVAEFAANDRVAKVYYTSDLGEYQVKYWMGWQRMEAWDYFTDNLDDAISTAQTAVLLENPANSPALGMSKAAYINRKSQITKKKPAPRLKKRRNYAYLMAQRGFKGAFPNPVAGDAVKYAWHQFKVSGSASKGWNIDGQSRSHGTIELPLGWRLTNILAELRKAHIFDVKATTRTVYLDDRQSDKLYLFATEDGYPLGVLIQQ